MKATTTTQSKSDLIFFYIFIFFIILHSIHEEWDVMNMMTLGFY